MRYGLRDLWRRFYSTHAFMTRSQMRISVSRMVTALLLCSCSDNDMLERLTPRDADARARDYLALFVRDRTDSALDRLHPTLQSPEARLELRRIADLLRNERFDTTRVIGALTNTVNGVRHVNLTYELHSSFSWFLANVATVDSANTWFVEGVSTRTIPQPLEVAAEFTLANRSLIHYLWLVLTVAAVLTSIGTALFLMTRRGMPRRWLWVLFACLGGGAFSLNWATGAVNFKLLNVQLLCGGFVRFGPASPWIIVFALPVGAIMGIAHYSRWQATQVASAELPPSSQAAI